MKKFRVPMSSPDISEKEREAVLRVLSTRHLSMGPEFRSFEKAIEDFVGVKHAISVNSGTAGLHLCIRAAGIEAGDLVITTPFSFMASSNVILFENAVPVFVDADPLTGNIDPVLLAKAASDIDAGGDAAKKWLPRKGVKVGAKLKAILPVDVFGQPADMDPIRAVADQYGLKIIEDSCEAIGAEYKGRKAGLLGDYGVFAFYPNKQMTTAEGGVVVTNDDEAASMMRALRNQGRAEGDTWLEHSYLGYNYRMQELSAAIGRVQVERLDELLDNREVVAGYYEKHLAGIPVEKINVVDDTTRMSWFVYVVRVEKGVDRDELIRKLADAGVPARPYFAPIHLQKFMVERFGFQAGDYPVTEDLGARGIALPFSGVMTEDQVMIVCEVLGELLG